jgi:hypothetical protein
MPVNTKALARERAKIASKKVYKPILQDPNFLKQNAFVNSTAPFLAAQCSRRAGKSSGLALRFFRTMETHPKSLCLYLSLTFDSAKSIMWPILQEMNETHKLGCTFTEGKMIMTHPNGAKLRLYGVDMKNFIKRLKGQKSPAIAIDEAQDMGSHLESLVDDVLTPMMSDYPDAWLTLTGTPGPIPRGYFFDVCQKGRDGYEVHNWTINDNPYMPNPEAFIQSLIAKKQWETNHPTLLREWRNKWVLDIESLWIKYKEKVNHFDNLPIKLKYNYILGIDWGFKDADALAVLAYSDDSPDTYLVEEVLTTKQGPDALAQQIKVLMGKYTIVKMVMDMGGGGLKMAEDFVTRYQLPITPAKKTEKQAAVELFNDALRLGKFKAKADSRFAQDSYLIQIDWEKSTPDKTVIKKGFHSDVIDAALYAFRESPAYGYSAPVTGPVYGSQEWGLIEQEKMREAMYKQIQDDKNQLNDQYETYEGGGPDLSKWRKG